MRRTLVVLPVALIALAGLTGENVGGSQSPGSPGGRGEAPPAPSRPYWARRGCSHGHPSRVAYRRVRALTHSVRPLTRPRVRRAHHYVACVGTAAKSRAVRRSYLRGLAWRRSYGPYWRIRLYALPAFWRRWAWCVDGRESGHRQVARESGFLSHFQWVLSTWLAAGGTGNPERASYAHQAVIAIGLARREGVHHWPRNGAPCLSA